MKQGKPVEVTGPHSLDETRLVIEIQKLSPVHAIRATAYASGLLGSGLQIVVTVGWEGVGRLASIIRTEVDPEPWLRCLQVAWAVVGPETAPGEGEFDSHSWSSLALTVPEVDGDTQQVVRVVLERDSWTAKLSRMDGNMKSAELEIPNELRSMDGGTLLIEMSSRLLLGIPWT